VKFRELSITGAYEVTPQVRGDDRGSFHEWYRHDFHAQAVGHPLTLMQANISVSGAGVLRGVHFADVPPGQAKYVTCVRGALVDVVVDIRVGSPTFGRWEMVRLDDIDRRSVYIAEGLGHAFCALSDDTTVVYMCSAAYNPAGEHTIDPLDPVLGIDWPVSSPILSPRDAEAPSLQEARERGLLPSYEVCRQYTRKLTEGSRVTLGAGPATV
jgi:dTDP-4-dehydrorhamnose 3,5-epimerase